MPKPIPRNATRRKYPFSLILADVDASRAELEDALFESGCDDALLGSRDGVWFLDFERAAGSLLEAVVSAVRDVSNSGIELRVDRVEPDDWVTASEIARRIGRSRESIRQLIHGERGPGTFPAPIANVKTRSPLWRWSDVATWFENALAESAGRPSEDARDLAMINAALALQQNVRNIELLNQLWAAGGSRYDLKIRRGRGRS